MKYLWCCGIGAANLEASPDGAVSGNRNVPEPKIERKCFVILNSNLSKF
jgi:hypothetical protein